VLTSLNTHTRPLITVDQQVDPIRVGPFVLQGLFLQRQSEVSAEFSQFFSANVLTSKKIWRVLLFGARAPAFYRLLNKVNL
jgi:hypothetical protein